MSVVLLTPFQVSERCGLARSTLRNVVSAATDRDSSRSARLCATARTIYKRGSMLNHDAGRHPTRRRRASATPVRICAALETAMTTRRRPNYRLAKIHRNYTVAEVADVFGVHRNTVREWIKRGLPTCDCKRPTLILGRDLSAFLLTRRMKNKRPCKPGELYCVRCREPRAPAGNFAEYQPGKAGAGNLIAICSACEAMMYRRVNIAKLGAVQGQLDITMPQALPHIGDSSGFSVNSDLRQEAR